jgi:hypothetical protein
VDKFGIRRTTLAALLLWAAVFLAVGNGDFLRRNLLGGRVKCATFYAAFLYINLSLMRFLGQNMLPMQGRLQIVKSFSKNQGIAIGIEGMFVAIGTGFAPRIMRFLSANGGWERAYGRLFTVAAAAVVVFYFLFKDGGGGNRNGWKRNAATGSSARVRGGISKVKLLKMPMFWCLMLPLCFNAFIGTGTTVHITDIFREIGAEEHLAINSYAYLCAISVASGIAFGRQLDSNRIKLCILAQLSLQLLGLMGLEFSKNIFGFALYVFCIGCSWGGYNILRTAAWSKIFGAKNIGDILGLVYFCSATVGAVSASLMSYCMGLTGSYFHLMHAAECAIGVTMIFVAKNFNAGRRLAAEKL